MNLKRPETHFEAQEELPSHPECGHLVARGEKDTRERCPCGTRGRALWDGFPTVPAPPDRHHSGLHATILHLMGFDHAKLTYRHAGRDFRLTDVHGSVVRDILA